MCQFRPPSRMQHSSQKKIVVEIPVLYWNIQALCGNPLLALDATSWRKEHEFLYWANSNLGYVIPNSWRFPSLAVRLPSGSQTWQWEIHGESLIPYVYIYTYAYIYTYPVCKTMKPQIMYHYSIIITNYCYYYYFLLLLLSIPYTCQFCWYYHHVLLDRQGATHPGNKIKWTNRTDVNIK